MGNVQKTLKGGSEDSEGSEFWLNQGSDSQKDSSLADSELGSGETIFLYIQMEYCPRYKMFLLSKLQGRNLWKVLMFIEPKKLSIISLLI